MEQIELINEDTFSSLVVAENKNIHIPLCAPKEEQSLRNPPR
jgi:hypothetical protein